MSNKGTQATDEQMQSRIDQALQLLEEGMSSAAVVRSLAKDYGVSHRQARRYVNAATLEMFDAPLTHTELGFGIARDIDRLEMLQEAAHQAQDHKLEIKATQAVATLRENRLKALQRDDQFTQRIRVR